MNGKGCFKYTDGKVYYGEWVNNIKNGFGMLKTTNGFIYIGEYDNDKK